MTHPRSPQAARDGLREALEETAVNRHFALFHDSQRFSSCTEPLCARAWAALAAATPEPPTGCGCTIHDDRGEPCQSIDALCVPCWSQCWGVPLATPEQGLDVERLASALKQADDTQGLNGYREWAERIAAAYVLADRSAIRAAFSQIVEEENSRGARNVAIGWLDAAMGATTTDLAYTPDSGLGDLHRLIDEWHEHQLAVAFEELRAHREATPEPPHYFREINSALAARLSRAADEGTADG